MRVTVSFADGRLEEFDSDRLTRPDPLPGRSVLSDLVLSAGGRRYVARARLLRLPGSRGGRGAQEAPRMASAARDGKGARQRCPGWTSTAPARWLRAGDGLVERVAARGRPRCARRRAVRPPDACRLGVPHRPLDPRGGRRRPARRGTERVCALGWVCLTGSLEFLSRVRATVSQTSDSGFGGAS
jgi:hypothetical protein